MAHHLFVRKIHTFPWPHAFSIHTIEPCICSAIERCDAMHLTISLVGVIVRGGCKRRGAIEMVELPYKNVIGHGCCPENSILDVTHVW